MCMYVPLEKGHKVNIDQREILILKTPLYPCKELFVVTGGELYLIYLMHIFLIDLAMAHIIYTKQEYKICVALKEYCCTKAKLR